MKRASTTIGIAVLSVVWVAGCETNGGGGDDAGGSEALSDGARFDDEPEACDLLTPQTVAETFGVPANDLDQKDIMGCIYNWEGDGEELEANVMMIRAHESETRAADWFAKATKNQTAEEMQKAVDEASKRLDKKLDKKVEKDAAKGIMKAVSSEGAAYEDVPGVKDEARVRSRDGSLYVRVDNLTFTLSAYKGPEKPKLKVGRGDDVVTAAKKQGKAWAKKTAPQRKKDAAKLAKAVVAKL